MFAPNTVLEELTKTIRFGRSKLRGLFDVYNVLNGNRIVSVNSRYGPSWLQATNNVSPRLFKVGAQLDF